MALRLGCLALLTPNITHIAAQAIRNSTRVYLEAYTSILMVDKERLVCRGN